MKKLAILFLLVLILGLSGCSSKAQFDNTWHDANDIQIKYFASSLSGSGQYRWISDDMMEIKYTQSGLTWIVDQSNIYIRIGEIKPMN